jgi:exonuclease SbcC
VQLQQLVLRDFQAHSHRVVNFGPGITTIMGPTDIGKSAILRALRWACLNDFSGDDFVRYGAKKAEVTLLVKEGGKEWEIRRTKGSGQNTYHLNGKEYKAFGTGVPEDIERLLRLAPINFQDQHDPPFWFSETAGEVSRRLNSVVDLSLMDEALGYVAGQIRRLQEKRTWHEEKLKSLEAEMVQFEGLEEKAQDFREAKALLAEWEKVQKRRQSLQSLIENLLSIQDQAAPLKRLCQEGEALLKQIDDWKEKKASVQRLRRLVEQAEEIHRTLREPVPDLDELEEAWQKLKEISSRKEALALLIAKASASLDQLNRAKEEMERAEEKLHSVKGQPCPVCGQPLP